LDEVEKDAMSSGVKTQEIVDELKEIRKNAHIT
jgi:hypothetical protein